MSEMRSALPQRSAAPAGLRILGGAAPEKCQCCPIRDRAVCRYSDADELTRLDRIKSYRTYTAGAEIVGAGEETGFVGSVVSGVVKLTKTLVDGRRQMVGLLFPSDFVGRTSASRSECDVIAATDVTLCLFERRPFEALMHASPHLERRLLEMTLNELDATREWLVLLGRKNAREKVASFLCQLIRRAAVRPGVTGATRVRIPLTREDMADYLGLTIETVSRQMSGLKRDGVIAFSDAREIEVADVDALLEMSGDDGEGGVVP